MDVCLLWVLCVVRYRFLRRIDHSSRGVLPTVARRCVWSRNLENEEAKARYRAVKIQPQWVVTPRKQTTSNTKVKILFVIAAIDSIQNHHQRHMTIKRGLNKESLLWEYFVSRCSKVSRNKYKYTIRRRLSLHYILVYSRRDRVRCRQYACYFCSVSLWTDILILNASQHENYILVGFYSLSSGSWLPQLQLLAEHW